MLINYANLDYTIQIYALLFDVGLVADMAPDADSSYNHLRVCDTNELFRQIAATMLPGGSLSEFRALIINLKCKI